ncbi:MAG: hypothetical protein ACR2K3_01680 [Nocardioides sp.]
MPVLAEPVPRPLARLLRAAVLDLATSEHRRRFPAVVRFGDPATDPVAVPDTPELDHGLRLDLAASALHLAARRGDVGLVWLTRSGHLCLHDTDMAWLSAVLAAAAERGASPTMVVVTRHGWFDPRSGVRREWRRIRQR